MKLNSVVIYFVLTAQNFSGQYKNFVNYPPKLEISEPNALDKIHKFVFFG